MTRRELLKATVLAAAGAVVCALPEAAQARRGGGRRGGRGRRGYRPQALSAKTSDTIKRLGDPEWYQDEFKNIRELHEAAMRQVELNLRHPGGVGLDSFSAPGAP